LGGKMLKINNSTVSLLQGDITKVEVDAIVNAANSSLMGGGGVDGAIHRAGGPAILEECKKIISKINYLPTGEAVITTGGNLPAKYVIHTVGPIWRGGNNNEPQLLSNAYKNSLKLALENNIKTIAFPSISTGVYRFPVKEASEIALKTIIDFLKENNNFEKVLMVLFSKNVYDIYLETLNNFKKEV
jgi:O-acetyl-ADP-ribose deacetylase (regulator of RNase III)